MPFSSAVSAVGSILGSQVLYCSSAYLLNEGKNRVDGLLCHSFGEGGTRAAKFYRSFSASW